MTTATLPAPAGSDRRADNDDVDHLYCCDPDVAICGVDLSGIPEGFEFDNLCRYCAYLERNRLGCPVAACRVR